MKYIVTGLVALAILAGGAFFMVNKGEEERPVGASAGPEHTEYELFYSGLAEGNRCFATTTSGTLSADILRNHSCITIQAAGAGQAALTLTLAASTTLGSVLPREGMCRAWWVDANAVAAGTTTTLAAGTGVNVVGLDATGQGTGADVMDGDEFGMFRLCREKSTDITAFVQEYIHAD